MKIFRVLFFAVLLMVFVLPGRAAATELSNVEDELYRESGADGLFSALPEETQNLLQSAGIDPKHIENTDSNRLFSALSAAVQTELSAPLRALLVLLGVSVLSAAVYEYAPENLHLTVCLCGAAAGAVVLLPRITGLIGETGTVLRATGAFLAAAVPVYAGLLVSAGNPVTGSTYGALTLTAANAIPVLGSGLLLPFLRAYLALCVVSSVTTHDFGKLTDGLYKAAKWLLVLAVTVFSGILSVQTLVSAHTDALTGRTAKLLASSAVPIVGSAFGDAVSTIAGSVALLKSGAGAFGLLASLLVFLPVAAKAFVWLCVCLLGSFAAELFAQKKLASFLTGCAAAVKLLMAVVCSAGAVSVVAAAVVLCVRGAYA